MSQVVDRELDARGLRCPLPLLKARQALNGLVSGQILRVFTTDPASLPDFSAYARQAGHELIQAEATSEGAYVVVLRKR